MFKGEHDVTSDYIGIQKRYLPIVKGSSASLDDLIFKSLVPIILHEESLDLGLAVPARAVSKLGKCLKMCPTWHSKPLITTGETGKHSPC